MGSSIVLVSVSLFLTIFIGFSTGFLQQQSEKYYSIALKNAGENKMAEDGQSDQFHSLVRNSRSIHILFPSNEGFYTKPNPPPPNSMTQETTTTPRTTSRRPPKQFPHTNPNSSSDKKFPASKNCNPNCGCSNQYIPFCASNNVTYRNKCQLNCAQLKCDPGIRRKFEGVCPVPYVHHKPAHRKFRYTFYS